MKNIIKLEISIRPILFIPLVQYLFNMTQNYSFPKKIGSSCSKILFKDNHKLKIDKYFDYKPLFYVAMVILFK